MSMHVLVICLKLLIMIFGYCYFIMLSIGIFSQNH